MPFLCLWAFLNNVEHCIVSVSQVSLLHCVPKKRDQVFDDKLK